MVSGYMRDELINTAVNLKIAPLNSNILGKAINLLEKNDISITVIAELLKNDMGVVSKLISIANSAFYRIGMPVNNIERAIITIGQTELKSILFCLFYLGEITNFLKFKKKDLFYLLKHCVFVAHGARLLSKRLLIDDPEDVFTVSLLHDIGKVVFFMNLDGYEDLINESDIGKVVFFMNLDGYEDLINESLEKNIPLPLLERERYGIDHQEIGNILGLKWKLPPIFLSIIENHHNKMDNNTGYTDILKLVSCADRFFYYRDGDEQPEIFILKKEAEGIETEIEKLVYIIHN